MKSHALLLRAVDFKGEDAAGAIGEVAFVELVVRMVGQRRMVDLLHLRLCLEIFDDASRC